MGLYKDYKNMAAMAMMAVNGYDGEMPASPKPELNKSQRKKCKSCANFTKKSYKGSCPYHSIVDPWQAACKEHYKKRNK